MRTDGRGRQELCEGLGEKRQTELRKGRASSLLAVVDMILSNYGPIRSEPWLLQIIEKSITFSVKDSLLVWTQEAEGCPEKGEELLPAANSPLRSCGPILPLKTTIKSGTFF